MSILLLMDTIPEWDKSRCILCGRKEEEHDEGEWQYHLLRIVQEGWRGGGFTEPQGRPVH